MIPLIIILGAAASGAYGGVEDYIIMQGPDSTLGGCFMV